MGETGGIPLYLDPMAPIASDGFRLWPGRLDAQAQRALMAEVLERLDAAPPYRPVTPGGKPMSVEMSGFGDLGWITDARGYRYAPRHPVTGRPWPAIPAALLDLWAELADPRVAPDACLVNLYRDGARLGLHQDRDEADVRFPVLSVSLGDTAIFRIGGARRSDPTRSIRLASGDVCLLGGAARLAHHGVDRILPGSSRLVPGGGRINLTLRRATAAPEEIFAAAL
jgi:alkylated DNA repair protein (DNA oxidative demethylase)